MLIPETGEKIPVIIFIHFRSERLTMKIIFAKILKSYNIFCRNLLSIKSAIMSVKKTLKFFVILLLSPCISVFSQNLSVSGTSSGHVLDSLRSNGIIFNDNQKKPEIILSVNQAVRFLQYRYQPQFWNNMSDPLRLAIGQLVSHATNPPFDSTAHLLKRYPFDSLNIPWDKFYIWEPLRVRIPVTIRKPLQIQSENTINQDSSLNKNVSDSLNIKTVQAPGYSFRPAAIQKDTSIMVIIDTLHEVTSAYPGFPFRYFSYPYQSDSIKIAVNALLKYLEDRDSTIIYFTGIGKTVIPVWFNSRSGTMVRYWLKNDLNDSVTVWIGNTSRDTIGLYPEKEVAFRRPPKQKNYSDARINVKELDKSRLLEGQKIFIRPRIWKKRMEANFIMNQTALSNWIKGGENSLALSMDITEYVNYENKPLNLTSANFARIKLGFMASGGNPIRKNLDLLETNSKLNHKAFGKFDFSAIMLFKTQLLSGYNYSGDNKVLVSKILNPAVLTLGIGLDYKPTRTTSINFSP